MNYALFLLCFLVFFPFSNACGSDTIIFYQVGQGEPGLWSEMKQYFSGKGYIVEIFESDVTLEKQIQSANKINMIKNSILIGMELVSSESQDIFIALPDVKKSNGAILEIDEVPAKHAEESEKLALAIAAPYEKRVKRLPLFISLGIDIPQVFLRIGCPAGGSGAVFQKLHNSIQGYLKQGAKNESERKSK